MYEKQYQSRYVCVCVCVVLCVCVQYIFNYTNDWKVQKGASELSCYNCQHLLYSLENITYQLLYISLSYHISCVPPSITLFWL